MSSVVLRIPALGINGVEIERISFAKPQRLEVHDRLSRYPLYTATTRVDGITVDMTQEQAEKFLQALGQDFSGLDSRIDSRIEQLERDLAICRFELKLQTDQLRAYRAIVSQSAWRYRFTFFWMNVTEVILYQRLEAQKAGAPLRKTKRSPGRLI